MTSKKKTDPDLIEVNLGDFEQLKKNFPPDWIEVIDKLQKPSKTDDEN